MVESSRYRVKRRSIISFPEFSGMMSGLSASGRMDLVTKQSLLAVFYFTGLRIAEVVGDNQRKWKVLNEKGRQLSRTPQGLPEIWMEFAEGSLWDWRKRQSLPGIIKEDMVVEGGLLYLSSEPLKHGRRGDPLELSLKFPYVDAIVAQWKRAAEGKRVWPISQTSARTIVRQAELHLYPHAFRMSLASAMARDPRMSISDLQAWFGWSRSSTADAYLTEQRSRVKARESIRRMVKDRGGIPEV